MSVIDNAEKLLLFLAEFLPPGEDATDRGRWSLRGSKLAEGTGLDRNAVADAATYLENRDLASVQKYLAEDGLEVELTAEGRAAAEEITTERSDKPPKEGERELVSNADKRKVFIVHGRNHDAKRAVCALLKAIDLKPLTWEEAVASTKQGNPNIWKIIEHGFDQCHTAVVILTGDERVQLLKEFQETHDKQRDKMVGYQSRPNVFIEMGAALARGKERTLIVQIGEHRELSDIGGFHLLHLNDSPEKRREFVQRMRSIGASVDDASNNFLRDGDFSAAAKKSEEAISEVSAALADEADGRCPLASGQEKLLAILANHSDAPLSIPTLATRLGESVPMVTHYANELAKPQHGEGLVVLSQNVNPTVPIDVSIVDAGLKLAVDRGLVK